MESGSFFTVILFSLPKVSSITGTVLSRVLNSNAEQILYCLYYRVHPDKIGENINEKPDWELLKENGGPLTNEEFDNETSEYFSVPSVTVAPVKKQYFKINKNN